MIELKRLVPLAVLLGGCVSTAAPLRLRQVVLYQNGMGYFERSGRFEGGELRLRIRPHEVDDVLKTMAVIERGARAEPVAVTLRHAEGRERRTASLAIALGAARPRELQIAYAVPTPVWRATYRIVMPDARGGQALLQGWAMINNVSDEDWREVRLELATGAPLSFALDLRTPHFVARPDLTGRLVTPVALGPVAAERGRGGDSDADGVADKDDRCPNEPEDRDGFEDQDGCPDPDNDKDGIADDKDLCPNEPEDRDGFEDQDGCPDPDNDKDRIPDARDRCPNEPETYNGYEDEDGCPDKGRVVVYQGRIEILDKLYFETNQARIKAISRPILDAIAATLLGNPQIVSLEIQGHAAANEREVWSLSGERAGAVRAALARAGVRTTLKATAYGDTRPIDRDASEAARSKNRRVEFQILERRDRGYSSSRESPPPPAPSPAGRVAVREVAGGVRYALPGTVTIPAQASVQVSILDRKLRGEEIFLFRPEANLPGSERHPMRAIRIENESGLTLVPGPVAIFIGGTFSGEGQLAELKPKESAAIPYALDTGTTIATHTSASERPVRILTVVDGVATVEDQQVHVTSYEIRTGARVPARIFLRHPRRPGTIAAGLPPRSELGSEAYLMPIPISPSRTSSLRIEERAPLRRSIRLADDDSTRLELYLGPGVAPSDEKPLRAVIALRRQQSELEDRVRRLRERLGDLGQRAGELRRTLRTIERSRTAEALRRTLLARLKAVSAETEAAAQELASKASAESEARERFAEGLRRLRVGPPSAP
jgi:outer membrane protein OmpA-like peptidoglycan-associated protein